MSAPTLRVRTEAAHGPGVHDAAMEAGTGSSSGVPDRGDGPHIVVGVDGSAGAVRALSFAIEEARRRGVRLRVVGAWHVPSSAYMAVPMPMDYSDEYERATRMAIDRTLTTVGRPADVPIDIVIAQGQPGSVLVEQARHAQALVVGSRGLGGFRDLLLGSVSHACAQHALCPVLVVPHEARPAPTEVNA